MTKRHTSWNVTFVLPSLQAEERKHRELRPCQKGPKRNSEAGRASTTWRGMSSSSHLAISLAICAPSDNDNRPAGSSRGGLPRTRKRWLEAMAEEDLSNVTIHDQPGAKFRYRDFLLLRILWQRVPVESR